MNEEHGPIVTALRARRSTRPRRLVSPAPGAEALETMIEAATRAPDHGHLRPWRFLVVEGEDRKWLGDRLVESYRRRQPQATDDDLERQRDKAAAKDPMLIGLVAHLTDHPAVPHDEQKYAVMIAGGYLMLAATELGFGTILLSGDHVRDRQLNHELGLAENEQLLGWINIGAPEPQTDERKNTEKPPAQSLIYRLGIT
ncbi:MAG: nitroreductase [Guyparkeria sp.]